MVAAFSSDISAFLSLALLTWNLSSSLGFLGRLRKSRWSWLDWHLSGPRSTAFSDHCLSTFICSTTYYGAFPNAFSSSDTLLLVNGTLSPTQKLKFWPPHLYIDFNIYGFFNKTFSLMPLLKDDTNAKLLTFCNSLSYYNILTFR